MSEIRLIVVGVMLVTSACMLIVATTMVIGAQTPETRARGSVLGISGGFLLLFSTLVAR